MAPDDLVDGALRAVRRHGIEVLRASACVVRARDRGTIAPEIRGLGVGRDGAGFLVRYQARCPGPEGASSARRRRDGPSVRRLSLVGDLGAASTAGTGAETEIALGGPRGAMPRLACRSSRPGRVAAFAAERDGRTSLRLANLAPEEPRVAVPAGFRTVPVLDETTWGDAAWGEPLPTGPRAPTLLFPPPAVAHPET